LSFASCLLPLVFGLQADFKIDMNGKRNPWEGVNLLPFINSETLMAAGAVRVRVRVRVGAIRVSVVRVRVCACVRARARVRVRGRGVCVCDVVFKVKKR
jgi:hypothetical protein